MKIEMHSGWMAVIVTLIIALTGAAYKFGTDISGERVEHLERLVAELRESSHLNYPETIKALRDASYALVLNKGDQDKLKNLVAENNTLKGEVATLKNMVDEYEAKVKRLIADFDRKETEFVSKLNEVNDKLKEYEISSEIIILGRGQGLELVKGKLSLGVGSIYDDYAWVYLNNESGTMHVGNVKTAKHGNRECQLRLIELITKNDGAKEAKFSFGCVDK